MELYYYAGKDAKTGNPVYIKCVIIEDRETYVKAKSIKTGHVFTARHIDFCLCI